MLTTNDLCDAMLEFQQKAYAQRKLANECTPFNAEAGASIKELADHWQAIADRFEAAWRAACAQEV